MASALYTPELQYQQFNTGNQIIQNWTVRYHLVHQTCQCMPLLSKRLNFKKHEIPFFHILYFLTNFSFMYCCCKPLFNVKLPKHTLFKDDFVSCTSDFDKLVNCKEYNYNHKKQHMQGILVYCLKQINKFYINDLVFFIIFCSLYHLTYYYIYLYYTLKPRWVLCVGQK